MPCLIENFALALNKCAHFFEIDRQGEQNFVYQKERDKTQAFLFRQTFDDRTSNQKDHRGRPKKVKRKFEIEFDFAPELIEHVSRRQDQLRESWKESGWQMESKDFNPDFRLIMGLGTASVFETSLTLHHVYGIPYLPASSIKGVMRSWVIVNYFDYNEKQAMEDPVFAFIFRANSIDSADKTARRGHITFFDAFPQSPPVIEPDIMNVHYPDWYSKGKAPTDTQSPNPIPFLTVGKCDANQQPLQVRFDLAVRENQSCENILKEAEAKLEKGDAKIENKLLPSLNLDLQTNILQLAQQLLASALTSHGLGAKTALGYGFFSPTSNP